MARQNQERTDWGRTPQGLFLRRSLYEIKHLGGILGVVVEDVCVVY